MLISIYFYVDMRFDMIIIKFSLSCRLKMESVAEISEREPPQVVVKSRKCTIAVRKNTNRNIIRKVSSIWESLNAQNCQKSQFEAHSKSAPFKSQKFCV